MESEFSRSAGEERDIPAEKKEKKEEEPKGTVERSQGSRLVTSDGTYATQSAFSMEPIPSKVPTQALTLQCYIGLCF